MIEGEIADLDLDPQEEEMIEEDTIDPQEEDTMTRDLTPGAEGTVKETTETMTEEIAEVLTGERGIEVLTEAEETIRLKEKTDGKSLIRQEVEVKGREIELKIPQEGLTELRETKVRKRQELPPNPRREPMS